MPDKMLFYVWEDGQEVYCVYDAVDGSDAWAQHCAAGLADLAERDFHTVAPLSAEAVNKRNSDLDALQYAALAVCAAWLDKGGATGDRELDRALEALQEVLDG